ncbi:hypothetical protein [Comamonas odontotermitis]|uniref:hypothetical protein n=1 Tax=Comamonas odontotermitis TaxID=379895 RepID=UPI001CC3B8B7|nr:hypothetical protein [Comamonas odontotermitis]UBB18550.1 hypothetical protein LAD35_07915 [Comamonas odontotermitis]
MNIQRWDNLCVEELAAERAAFWTPQRCVQARAMRGYRQLWAKLDAHQQFQLESYVCLAQFRGVCEAEITAIICRAIAHAQPWLATEKEQLIVITELTQN